MLLFLRKSTLSHSISFFLIFLLHETCATELNFVADEINITNDGKYMEAIGNVKIISKNRTLITEKIIYDSSSKEVLIPGPLEIIDRNGLKIKAKSSTISPELKNSYSKQVKAIFDENFQISADEVRYNYNRKTMFLNTMGTTCKICSNDKNPPIWVIKAKSIEHRQDEKSLIFTNAWLEIAGIPVIYSPYIKTPEPGITRASGLLTPSLISSDLLGFGVKQPFFIVLDRSSDLTLSILKTNQTSLIEAEVRSLFQKGHLNITGAIEPVISDKSVKGFLTIEGENSATEETTINYKTTLISDRDFLMKYGYDQKDFIENRVSLRQHNKYQRVQLEAFFFQSLRTPEEREPLVMPNYSNKRISSLLGGELQVSNDFSILGLTKTNQKLIRLSQETELTRTQVLRNGLNWRNSLTLSGLMYLKWDETKTQDQSNKLRPVISTDISFPLIRKNQTKLEIITPKIQLVYSPSDEGSADINEDSTQVDFDRTNLFSTNRYPGKDRQEFGFWINAGIKYANKLENNRRFGSEFGQIYRLEKYDQFSSLSGLAGEQSDILISSYYETGSNFKFTNSLFLNTNLRLRRSETDIEIKNKKSKISGSLFYNSDAIHLINQERIAEMALAAETKLNDNWQALFAIRHDLVSNQTTNAAAGLVFENECVDLSINLSKRFSGSKNLPEDTRFEISFDLGGFGKEKQLTRKCLKVD